MIRQRCNQMVDKKRCKNTFRARLNHDFCRECHKGMYYGESREIKSRVRKHKTIKRIKSMSTSKSSKTQKKINETITD